MTTTLITSEGGTTRLDDTVIESLSSRLNGSLLEPGDDGYAEATLLWNGDIRKTPALVVQAASAADVAAAVDLARTEGLALSVRGGGHNVAGTALVDGGLTIDLSQMRHVRVDPTAATAVVGGGCLLSDMDRATQEHSLATPLGFNSETGVGGLTLGGGFGYLTRRFGWTVDNLLGVEIVTADGKISWVDSDQDPDLFWAIRGAGANFGVVTSFMFRLHQVGPMVHGGLLVWPFERADEVMDAYQALTDQSPRELAAFMIMLRAPEAPFLPKEMWGRRGCAFTVCHSGPAESVEHDLAPLRELGPPIFERFGEIPYVAVQSYLDATQPKGMSQYWKSEFTPGLGDDLTSTMAGLFDDCPIPGGMVMINHVEGSLNEKDDGAVGNRDAKFVVSVNGKWPPNDPEGDAHRQWLRDAWKEFRSFSTGASYVNFQTADEQDERIHDSYGANYRRLLEVKQTYDPGNMFKSNRNLTA